MPARLRQNTGAALGAAEPDQRGRGAAEPVPRSRHRRADGGRGRRRALRARARSRPSSPSSPRAAPPPRSTARPVPSGWATPTWTPIGAGSRSASGGRGTCPYVDVLPAGGRATTVEAVEIAGVRHRVKPGWNRIAAGPARRDARSACCCAATPTPSDLRQGNGLAEVRIPGLRMRESLRPADAGAVGASRARPEPVEPDATCSPAPRATARSGVTRAGGRCATRARGAFEDPEAAQHPRRDGRRARPGPAHRPACAARAYRVDAWTSLSPDAPDSRDRPPGRRAHGGALRLVGPLPGPGPLPGVGRVRPRPRHGVGGRPPGRRRARSLSWRTPRRRAGSRRLRLMPAGAARRRRPPGCGCASTADASPVLRVGPDGTVDPAPRRSPARALPAARWCAASRPRADRGRHAGHGGHRRAWPGPACRWRARPRARALPARAAATRPCARPPAPGPAAGVRHRGRPGGRAGRCAPAAAARAAALPAGGQRPDHAAGAWCAWTTCACARRRRRARPPVAAAERCSTPARTDRGRHEDVRVRRGRTRLAGAGRELQPRLAGVLRRPRPGRAARWSTATPTAGARRADCRDVDHGLRAPSAGHERRGTSSRLVACALLLVFLLLGRRRRRRSGPPSRTRSTRPPAPARWPLPAAAAAGRRGAAWRRGSCSACAPGPGAALLVGLVLWRGVGWRPLLAARCRPAGRGGPGGLPAVPARPTWAATTRTTPSA